MNTENRHLSLQVDALHLGDALHQAVVADLARTEEAPTTEKQPAREGSPARVRPRRRIGTRTAVALAAAALAVPAAAIATGVLTSDQEVAASIPSGSYAFTGTEPTCTTLRQGIEFECVLGRAPSGEVPPGSGKFVIEPGEWRGVVEGTVDDTDHVNGGCRSQNNDGTRWLCYLGKESIRQEILMPTALGQYLPEPAGP
jgi:hypothetical protein